MALIDMDNKTLLQAFTNLFFRALTNARTVVSLEGSKDDKSDQISEIREGDFADIKLEIPD